MDYQLWLDGNFITLDSENPQAQAMVTKGEKIVFIGSKQKTLDTFPELLSSAVYLDNKTVIPGFNDNHLHLVAHGQHVFAPNLWGLRVSEILSLLKSVYPNPEKGQILVGYDWDYSFCPEPHRNIIDQLFPDNAVILYQFSGHAMWVNTKALELMGAFKKEKPVGLGIMIVDAQGLPTGILREADTQSLLPDYHSRIYKKPQELQKRILKALSLYAQLGITSIQDNTWYWRTLPVLKKLKSKGLLTTRISVWSLGTKPKSIKWMNLGSYDGLWISRGPWKYFLDGAFSSHTAWLSEAYLGEPDNVGDGFEALWLERTLTLLADRKIQGAFHSIGDRATNQFLNVLEKAVIKYPWLVQARLRLEHVQLLCPGDESRLRELGVCVAAQPSALDSPEKDLKLLGCERAEKAYPYRRLLDAKVPLSFGSDIPGEKECNPILGIHRVVNRNEVVAITPYEALSCFTQGSAYVEFKENMKGTLKSGYLADFTVLSQNILDIEKANIKNTQILKTFVGGRKVYDSQELF